MVKVGDIFCNSWGWEQTQVDFYEVVRVSKTGKTGDLRPIGFEWTNPDDQNCNSVVPSVNGKQRYSSQNWDVRKNRRFSMDDKYGYRIWVNVAERADRSGYMQACSWNGTSLYFTPRNQPGY